MAEGGEEYNSSSEDDSDVSPFDSDDNDYDEKVADFGKLSLSYFIANSQFLRVPDTLEAPFPAFPSPTSRTPPIPLSPGFPPPSPSTAFNKNRRPALNVDLFSSLFIFNY